LLYAEESSASNGATSLLLPPPELVIGRTLLIAGLKTYFPVWWKTAAQDILALLAQQFASRRVLGGRGLVGDSVVQAEAIVTLAEAEFAAFLHGAEVGIGCGNQQAHGTAWIEMLISSEWPGHNYQNFFRTVTILTIIQLASREQPPTS
jgi:hypothetical protein